MTETFRAVEPLDDVWIEKTRGEDHVFIRATVWNVAEARALRDWLDKAIPEKPTVWFDAGYLGNGHCPFMRSYSSPSRADPRIKPEANQRDRQEMSAQREAFEDYINNRPDWWCRFEKESWRICSDGAPKAGEYADDLLQQLWECWQAAEAQAPRAKGSDKT